MDRRIKFVGGPHDGKFMTVPAGMEFVKMPKPKMVAVDFHADCQWPVAESFEVLLYDDCGDHTHYRLRNE